MPDPAASGTLTANAVATLTLNSFGACLVSHDGAATAAPIYVRFGGPAPVGGSGDYIVRGGTAKRFKFDSNMNIVKLLCTQAVAYSVEGV